MFKEDDAVMKVSRHGKKMSNQCIGRVYFLQTKAVLMGASYAILEFFDGPMRFPKTLLENITLPGSYWMISLRAFMAWVQSKSLGEEALNVRANFTH